MISAQNYTVRKTCRICLNPGLISFLSFPDMPLAGGFLYENEFATETNFPLTIVLCPTCKEVQTLETVSANVLFKDYRFLASTTKSLSSHFRDYANTMKNRFTLGSSSLVVEFGSNDGVLLKPFMDLGVPAVGVEPATNIAAVAKSRGCMVINDFFNLDTASTIESKNGLADLICANNVFAHIDDMHEVMRGVQKLLKNHGVFVFEVHYLLDLIEEYQYDMIYHEHMMYHSIQPLQWLMRAFDLEIFDVERHDIHCGSIRVFACRKTALNVYPIQSSISKLLDLEEKCQITSLNGLTTFAKNVMLKADKLHKIVNELSDKGKKVVGYGASGRASVHVNLSNLNTNILHYVVDDSPERSGRFMPGCHNPVVTSQHFRQDSADYAVVFAYNYIKEISEKESTFLKNGGSFILPSPDPCVLTPQR